ISFLPADVSSRAFGRDRAADPSALALDADEVREFRTIVERTIAAYAPDFDSGFIAESPERLRRLPRYYAALRGEAAFPTVSCTAPWVSVVVEANGDVRPCFFHEPVGSIRAATIDAIVGDNLARFRGG